MAEIEYMCPDCMDFKAESKRAVNMHRTQKLGDGVHADPAKNQKPIKIRGRTLGGIK